MSNVALELERRATARAAAARLRQRQAARDGAVRAAAVAVVLVLWEVVGRQMSPFLFAPPSRIAAAAAEMLASGELWRYLSESLKVFVVGLSLGAVAGVLVGVAMARFRVLDLALEPMMIALYSTPTVALMPLVIVWFGLGLRAKAAVIFLFALFPILLNTYQGVKSVDPRLLEVARSFRSPERALWGDVIIPSSLPFIVAGLRLAIGRGLVGMLISDLYVAVSGIGYLIMRAQQHVRIDQMFVGILPLSLLGVTLVQGLRWLEGKVAPWQHQGRDD
ncbi:MAG: ABC transporter permease [Armatimonadota bacterium]|nr:ABC transporter permease [Armatimonadota bacterium]